MMCRQGDTITVMIKEKPVAVDCCIAEIVAALNQAGCQTTASCCGHGKQPGNIALADGREIIIAPDYETARKTEKILKEATK